MPPRHALYYGFSIGKEKVNPFDLPTNHPHITPYLLKCHTPFTHPHPPAHSLPTSSQTHLITSHICFLPPLPPQGIAVSAGTCDAYGLSERTEREKKRKEKKRKEKKRKEKKRKEKKKKRKQFVKCRAVSCRVASIRIRILAVSGEKKSPTFRDKRSRSPSSKGARKEGKETSPAHLSILSHHITYSEILNYIPQITQITLKMLIYIHPKHEFERKSLSPRF